MAEQKIRIVVGAETGDAAGKLQSFTVRTEGLFKQLADGIKLGLGIDIAGRLVSGLQRIPGILQAAVGQGVRFNQTLEGARLGIAAVVKQFDGVKFADFNDAIAEADKALEALKVKARESPASLEQLVGAFQAISGAAMSANIGLQEQVELTVLMSQALAGLGIRSEQIIQESRALLTGNINEDAMAARILGITRAQINEAREAGRLYEFLTERLMAFAEAGRVAAGTLTNIRSNFFDTLAQGLGELTVPIVEALKRGFKELDETVASSKFREDLEGIAANLARITTAGFGLANFAAQHAGVIADGFQGIAVAVGLATAALIAFNAQALIAPLAGLQRLSVAWATAAAGAGVLTRGLGSLRLILGSLAGVVAVVGAAFAGWSLGKVIQEFEVGGETIRTWVRLAWLEIFGAWEKIKAYLAGATDWIFSTLAIGWEKILIMLREKAIQAAEIVNKIPWVPDIDVEGMERKLRASNATLKQLEEDRARNLEEGVQKAADRLAAQKEALDAAAAELLGAGTGTEPGNESAGGAPGSGQGAALAEVSEQTRQFLDQIGQQYREATQTRLELARFEYEQALRRIQQEVEDVEEAEIAKLQLAEIFAQRRAEIEVEEGQKTLAQLQEQASKLQHEYQQRLIETNNLFEVGSIQGIEAIRRNNDAITEYREGLLELMDLLGVLAVTQPDLPGLGEEVARIREEVARLKGAFQDESFVGTMRRELRNLGDEWEAIGRNIARTMNTSVRRAVDGVSDSIMGMIDGTMTWGQAFANVARSIIADLIRVVVQWVAQMTIIRALQRVFHTERQVQAAQTAAAEAPAATLASISSYGAAAAIGVAALLAGLAIGIAAFSTGGLVRGKGGPREDRNLIAVSDREYVVSAAAVQHYGPAFLDRLNAMALGAADLASAVPAGVTRPVTLDADVERDLPGLRVMGGGGGVTVSPAPVNVAVINNKAQLREFLRSNEGRQVLVDEMTAAKMELGVES